MAAPGRRAAADRGPRDRASAARVCAAPECASPTRAELPRELPRSAFGPRLQAAVVTLAVRNRVSRRDTTELARELFGVELSTGSVDAIVQRAGEALAAPHTRLEQRDQVGIGRQHRRDRLEDRRRQPDALGRADRPDRGVPDRGRPPRLRGQDAARRALRRDRLLGPLARLRLPRPHPPAALLGPPAPRLHRPQRRHGRTEDVRRHTASGSPTTSSPPGTATRTTATGPGCKRRPRRSKTSSARCSSTPPARARRRSTTASSPRTCSSAGPHSGPSPTPTASSRPTTTPNAASAAPSSTASSHSAANQTKANAPSNDSSPPRSPAASRNARSSPTSPTSSPPTSAATPSPPSPDHGQGLNAYAFRSPARHRRPLRSASGQRVGQRGRYRTRSKPATSAPFRALRHA